MRGAVWQAGVNMELKEVGDQVFAAECILKSRVRKVGADDSVVRRCCSATAVRLGSKRVYQTLDSDDVARPTCTTADLTPTTERKH